MIIWCERNLNFFVLNTIQFLNEFDITIPSPLPTTLPPLARLVSLSRRSRVKFLTRVFTNKSKITNRRSAK